MDANSCGFFTIPLKQYMSDSFDADGKFNYNRLHQLEKLVNEIKKEQDPAFITSQRGKSNVFFDEDAKVIQLGEKTTERNFLNVGHARKFMQTSVVMKKTHDYLQENKTAALDAILGGQQPTQPKKTSIFNKNPLEMLWNKLFK